MVAASSTRDGMKMKYKVTFRQAGRMPYAKGTSKPPTVEPMMNTPLNLVAESFSVI